MGFVQGTYLDNGPGGWSQFTPTAGFQDGFNTGAPGTSTTMMIFVSAQSGFDPTDYPFTVSAANARKGATYTNNGQTFTVLQTITGGTTLWTSNTGAASAAPGTLTRATDILHFHATSPPVNVVLGDTYTNNGQTFTIVASEQVSGTTWRNFFASSTGAGNPQTSGTLTRTSGTGDATVNFSSVERSDDTISYSSLISVVTSTQGSSTNPYRSLPKALAVITARAGSPDWLMFKIGDTWVDDNAGIQLFFGGLNDQNRLVIASYDPANPYVPNPGTIVNGNTKPHIWTNNFSDGVQEPGSNVAITGLDLYSYQRDPTNVDNYVGDNNINGNVGGIVVITTGFANQIWEDNLISYYAANAMGPSNSLHTGANGVIRRNVIHNIFANTIATGIETTANVNGLTIQENLIDKCGWSADGATPDVRSRDLYLTGGGQNTPNYPLTLGGNIVTRDASESQTRGGSYTNQNLFWQVAGGLNMGAPTSGYNLTINDNVVYEMTTPLSSHVGFAFPLFGDGWVNNQSPVSVNRNIIIQSATGGAISSGTYVPTAGQGFSYNSNIMYATSIGLTNDNGISVSNGYSTNGGIFDFDTFTGTGYTTGYVYYFAATSSTVGVVTTSVYEHIPSGTFFEVIANPFGGSTLVTGGLNDLGTTSGTLTKSSGPGPATITFNNVTHGFLWLFAGLNSPTNDIGETYTHNGQTFTTVSNGTTETLLYMHSTGSPLSSGTLTRATGSGTASITFNSVTSTFMNVVVTGGSGTGCSTNVYVDLSGNVVNMTMWGEAISGGLSPAGGNTCGTGYVVNDTLAYTPGFSNGSGFGCRVKTICTFTTTNNIWQSDTTINPNNFPDRTRNPSTYCSQVLGLDGTIGTFLATAYGQCKANWQANLTAPQMVSWIQEGFGIGAGSSAFDPMRSMGNRYGVYKTRPTKIPHAA